MLSARDIQGIRIDSGHYDEESPNRSDSIDAMLNRLDVELGSSWCCAFQVDSFNEAELKGAKVLLANGKPDPQAVRIHQTASTQELLHWFKDKGWAFTDPMHLWNCKGALAIRTNPDGETGHVLLVEKRFSVGAWGSKITKIGTMEGNTDGGGSADGEGAYRLTRKLPLTPYVWHFVDTTHVIAGQWW